ncbi:hypothetical protein RCH10_003828 [Variovorax sp. GrIS 2.14]|uniref:DUF5343 domain-containing protein n=1 Tax=Variovorax sp. GrIS 2.14 TaxID=3071709 RepID=UPI00199E0451|nr:DUF5343 domain-containing protein [Ramlibacter sp.]
MSTVSEKPKLTPAYGSFKSFNSFMEARRDDGHITDVVDRSLMSNFAGSTAGELLAALKYLGFVTERGAPTTLYREYVPAEDESRVPLLEAALKSAYPYLFAAENFNIERATSQQVLEQFRAQGINGSTLARAIMFFLAGAKQAGIKVSPNIRAPNVSIRLVGGAPKKTTLSFPKLTASLQAAAEAPRLPPPVADVHVFDIPIPIGRKVSVSIPKDFVDADWELFQTMLTAYIGHWKKQTAEMQTAAPAEKEDESL